MGTVTDFLEFRFKEKSGSGKTSIWQVINRAYDQEILLGHVKWYAPWRCYAFYPLGVNTLFEARCLREIADFTQDETDQHMGRGNYRG
jgi:hypothetical protein